MHALPHILIVDDNSTNLLYLEIILRNIPAKLIKALSGAEALSLVKDMDLSLAILDVQMPEMNGYELAVLLNEDRSEHKVPIIFLTANFPENARVLEGYKAGAVDYIVKPLNEIILISKIKIFLELYWQKQRIIDDTEKLRLSEEETRAAKLEVEELNQYQIKAIEDQRSQISLQVHDELGQAMTALKMDLNWVKLNLKDPEIAAQKIDKMLLMTNQVIKRVQRISAELHPGVLDDLGLIAAIEWYCEEFTERTGIPCLLFLGDAEPTSKSLNLALFRIIQESLTNVIRHSQATKVSIQLSIQPDVSLIISDDGIGIPAEKLESGKSFGLLGMRQRITQCGGTIEYSGSPGNGTSIIVYAPKTNEP